MCLHFQDQNDGLNCASDGDYANFRMTVCKKAFDLIKRVRRNVFLCNLPLG